MMRRKTVSVTMLTLLISTLSLVLNIQLADASGTIYIRADGSVDPPTAPISTVDNVTYTLAGNINDSIVVQRNDIVVDGAGCIVNGTGTGRGIDLTGRKNVTIMNAVVMSFEYGFYLHGGANNTILNNRVMLNTDYGVFLTGASHQSIVGNNITGNQGGVKLRESSAYNNMSNNEIKANDWSGIRLEAADNNYLSGNKITSNNDRGILLDSTSSNITLRNNILAKNNQNFGVLNPGPFSSLLNDIDVSNTVDGKPIYYWINKQNAVVPLDAGYVALVNCSNITVKNLNLTRNVQGILVGRTSSSTINQNSIIGNKYGVWISWASKNNNVSKNVIAGSDEGIFVGGSSCDNSVVQNNVTDNWRGIWLSHFTGNNISNNHIERNDIGIDLGTSSNCVISHNNLTRNSNAIEISTSNDCIVLRNNMVNNEFGIHLRRSSNNTILHNNIISCDFEAVDLIYWSSNNTISFNNITNNRYGFMLSYYSENNMITYNNVVDHKWAIGLFFDVPNNRFYHNNFVNYTRGVYHHSPGENFWDNSYPSGGNYWSDYTGVDEKRGPGQDLYGSDGIGDTSYRITTGNRDHYPLMKPYAGVHDIGITEIATSKTVVSQGYNVNIALDIINYGVHDENFNLTIYANATLIATFLNITLTCRNSTTVTFNWNTINWARGKYALSAESSSVPGEKDRTDNMLKEGWILISIPGDVDADGHVSLYDLTILGTAWNSRPGDPHWCANADVDGDLHVFLGDINIVGSHWNEVAS